MENCPVCKREMRLEAALGGYFTCPRHSIFRRAKNPNRVGHFGAGLGSPEPHHRKDFRR